MASNSGFTHLLPSGQSQVNTADDEFRSIKSFMKEWWEQEHYATDGSATSAGIAKHGAGRAFVGTASQLSNPTADNDGRLFFVTDDNVLRIGNVSTSSWSVVADNVTLGSNNSWTGFNDFSGGLETSDLSVNNAVVGVASYSSVIAAAGGFNVGATSSNFVDLTTTQNQFVSGDHLIASVRSRMGTNPYIVQYHAYILDSNHSTLRLVGVNDGASAVSVPSGTTVTILGFLNPDVPR